MDEKMRTYLLEQKQEQYGAFHKRLCPDTGYKIWGVRMPKLRAFAKQMAKLPRTFPQDDIECYEELMLYALSCAYRKMPLEEKFQELKFWLGYFDCWAFTDCVSSTLRFSREELPLVWEFALECLGVDHPYSRRFGLVLMLGHLMEPEYYRAVASAVSWVTDENYYVRMAQAWLLAELGTRDLDLVVNVLKSGTLEIFTHNKTISKLLDSYRIIREQKDYLKTLRRKEEHL